MKRTLLLVALPWFLVGCVKLAPVGDPFYRAVLSGNPRHPVALKAQGDAFYLQGQMKEARQCYQRLTDVAPERADGWLGLGQTQLELQEFDEAEEAFRQGLECNPTPRVRQALELSHCNALILLGQLDEARQTLQALAPGRENDALYHQVAGNWAFLAGDYAQAVAEYRRSLELQPGQEELQHRVQDLTAYMQ